MTGMRRILLLTGTPYRKDGAEKVAEAWVGPVTFQAKKIYTSKVTVQVIDAIYPKLPQRLNRRKKLDYVRSINDLVQCKDRNEILVDAILPFVDQKRQVLALSARCDKIKHLHDLQV